MKNLRVLLPALLALAALVAAVPPALAVHAPTCGAPDGSVADGVYVWLQPGCRGVLVWAGCDSAIVIAHAEVLGVLTYVDVCNVGAWLP